MEDWLQKFIRVVESGSFTKAAEQLHISQPALTIAVGKLEKKLKTELIVRGVRPLKLTVAGAIVYEAGVAQAHVLNNLQTKLGDFLSERQTVKIGMIDSVALIVSTYNEPLDELEKSADVSLIVNNSRYLRRAVEERQLDVAFVVEKDGINLSHYSLGSEVLVLVSSTTIAESMQQQVDRRFIQNFICYDQPSMTYELIISNLQRRCIEVATTLYSSSPDVMKSMVMRGRGVAVLPYLLVEEQLRNKELTILTENGEPVRVERCLETVSLGTKIVPNSVTTFVNSVAESIAKVTLEAKRYGA